MRVWGGGRWGLGNKIIIPQLIKHRRSVKRLLVTILIDWGEKKIPKRSIRNNVNKVLQCALSEIYLDERGPGEGV